MSDSQGKLTTEPESVDEMAHSLKQKKKNGSAKRVRFRSKDTVFPGHEKTEEEIKAEERIIRNVAKFARRRDSLLYACGLLLAIANAYLFSASPTDKLVTLNFWTYVVLYSIRVTRFLKFRIGWYLIDFCYVGNWMIWISVYFFPYNAIAFSIAYYFAIATLGFALVFYGNSYTFHSIDHLTSAFIHHNGMVVMTAMRWSSDPKLQAVLNAPGGDLLSNYKYCILAYSCWFVVYYVTIFIVFWPSIRRNKHECLYSLTISTSKIVHWWVHLLRGYFKGFLFMITHVVWCWGFGSISILAFYYKPINYLLTVTCVIMAAYNGSTFLFQYMVKYYQLGIESKKLAEHPERIISFDMGELVESIGSGRSVYSHQVEMDEDPSKPTSMATRFGTHMAKK